MKCGKEGEKLMGPLFPRLHVNDAPEKGGPRAPPRNKMALYEQLSIPSQRSGSRMTSTTLVHLNDGVSCPSASSSQASGQERSLLTSSCVQRSSFHSIDVVNRRSANSKHATATSVTSEPNFSNNFPFKATNFTGNSSRAAVCDSHPHQISKRNDLNPKQFTDEDDFMVPTFVEAETLVRMNKEKVPSINYSGNCTADSQKEVGISCNCAAQLWKSSKKFSMKPNIADKRSRKSEQVDVQHGKHPLVETQNGKQIVSSLDAEEGPSEQPKCMEDDRNPNVESNPLDDVGNTYTKAGLRGESNVDLLSHNKGCSEASTKAIYESITEGGDSFGISNEHPSRDPPEDCEGSHTEKNVNGKLQPDNGARNDDVSQAPVVVSVLGLEISPDDVVGVIGPKQFWKARRAIVNQQRIFSVQVFELHRLIQVQKFFAGSPHLVLDDDLYMKIPSTKMADNQGSLDENSRSKPLPTKQKPETLKPSMDAKCTADLSSGKLVSAGHDIIPNGFVSQAPTRVHSDCTPSQVGAVDGKNVPWCFPSAGPQWLLPVMSPSEGLVYKPFAGPGPPVNGLMAPAYGARPPVGLPFAGDIANMAYCLPGAPSFPHYGIHIMNPMLLGGICPEQNNAQLPKGAEQFPVEDSGFSAEMNANAKVYSQGSCNMFNKKANAFSCNVWTTVQASKETEFQGSTASTPCSRSRVQRAVDQRTKKRQSAESSQLKTSAMENSGHTQLQCKEQAGGVIKVVPHNPKFATESAARIFWSIQKEREQQD